jgi:hypothetical protein
MMADKSIKVYAPGGRVVGTVENVTVEMYPEHHYELRGNFVPEDGSTVDKIEFNPQVLPYTIDITGVTRCKHNVLHMGYIQRGRQPVMMTATCKLD